MKFTRTDSEDKTTLTITGSLDAMTAPEIRPTVDEIVGASPALVEVDVGGLELIDSSGVAVLVSLFKRLSGDGRTMKVVGLTGQPESIFRLLRLDRLLR